MRILSVLVIAVVASCTLLGAPAGDYSRWVNPFIGTGGHGHTFPGATTPFGMVQLSPDTRIDDWDGSSGYHYSDSVIYGFSHTHLSGTGIADYCDVLVMPAVGTAKNDFLKDNNPADGYRSTFSHNNETAEAGYYAVKLDKGKIYAEMTTTPRVGFHRYTFPRTNEATILLDLKWRDEVIDSHLRITGKNRVEGYRRSKSWAKDQIIFFSGEFSKDFDSAEVYEKTESHEKKWRYDGNGLSKEARTLKSAFRFNTAEGEKIMLKIALSPVSIEGARKNLETELAHWDFEGVRSDARAAWNKELSKIEVKGGSDSELTNFYTALYHTMIQPNIFQEVDGKYRGMDGVVRTLGDGSFKVQSSRFKVRGPGFEDESSNSATQTRNVKPGTWNPRSSRDAHYTVFSLWDTFRAAHPLYTIIDEERTVQFINTFIRQYEQGGKLPVWELAGNETNTMIGYNAVSVIADAMAKGIEGFDYEKAYEAAKHSSELDIEGLEAFRKRGYISMEDEQESVSRTLEYAYNSYCVAVMAKLFMEKRQKSDKMSTDVFVAIGHGRDSAFYKSFYRYQADYETHIKRSQYYQNIFDKQTGFMRPKQNGNWISPFAPNDVTFHFTEANSWQYTFFVPHDVNGLIELYGGKSKFAAKLDGLFTTEEKTIGREQPDITGLIGQYAHGNEPSHHIAYLYNYADQPWKTQFYVTKIMDEFYKPEPDGLIGNEDCGQMSAWYVLSAMGFYQVNPSVPEYAIGTPLFEEAKINLESGKTFIITKKGAGRYIKTARLNGEAHRRSYFSHNELKNGGLLEFEMSVEPVRGWFEVAPVSEVPFESLAVPTIEGKRVFEKETEVKMSTPSNARIFYTLDGSKPGWDSKEYAGPFQVNSTTTIKAISAAGKIESLVAESILNKMPHDWDIKLESTYNRQYTGGGPKGLIDGLRGTTNFASGEWQGYQDQDFIAVIDLKREQEITTLGAGFLQVARSWIWMPTRLEFETSLDGETFTKAATIETHFPEREMEHTIRDYEKTIAPVRARYVRVRATNLGVIPDWHPGAGFQAFIFVDEVFVR